MIDLRLGRWQDVLADVSGVDAVICDPPYGARNQDGYNAGAGGPTSTRGDVHTRDVSNRTAIQYASLSPDDISAFVRHWSPQTRGWIAAMTSHDLIPAWEDAHREAGRYVFAPVPCVIAGMSVRLMGDGPSSETVYLVVARPRAKRFLKWGALPGFYLSSRQTGSGAGRGKPLGLMRAIVRDYSRPGDLVCDPFAGYGTTARACASLGRRFVGAECDADAYAEAQRRLADVVTVDVQGVQRVRQEALL